MDKVLRVMVVDDDRQMVKTICDILRVKGYEPLPAFCGEEAVAKTTEDGADCVLMDIRMSGIDGIKALEMIRKNNPTLPVLLMSAFATEEQVEEAKRLGMTPVLPKPLDFQELFCFLSLFMKGERPDISQPLLYETLRSRIREELIPLLFQGANSLDGAKFQNPHSVRCWEQKGCMKAECPAYGNTEVSCWYRAGTFCGGKIQGTFVDKCGGCRQCEVFQESCPTLIEEIGEAINHLLYLLREEKDSSQKQLKNLVTANLPI